MALDQADGLIPRQSGDYMSKNDIEMNGASDEFARCWTAAGRHLNASAQGEIRSWLRAHLSPPYLEHLSFRLGNQLFFVRVEDDDDQLQVPGNRMGLEMVANACAGYACLMPMKRGKKGWVPVYPGWGLVDLTTGRLINPAVLITDDEIEMTDWELQDFAVQVVRSELEDNGRKLMSWQSNPEVNPAIWFVGDSGPEWVVVRAVRYPEDEAAVPDNIHEIAEHCSHMSRVGHFVSVGVVCMDGFQTGEDKLLRGYRLMPIFSGLTSI